jgi:hypothetical protein
VVVDVASPLWSVIESASPVVVSVVPAAAPAPVGAGGV